MRSGTPGSARRSRARPREQPPESRHDRRHQQHQRHGDERGYPAEVRHRVVDPPGDPRERHPAEPKPVRNGRGALSRARTAAPSATSPSKPKSNGGKLAMTRRAERNGRMSARITWRASAAPLAHRAAQLGEFRAGQVAQASRSEPAEADPGVRDAAQFLHGVPGGEAHPLDFVLAPLSQGQRDPGVLARAPQKAHVLRLRPSVLEVEPRCAGARARRLRCVP